MMGCNSSSAAGVIDQNKIKPIKNRKNRPGTPGPKSIAFEVQLDESDNSTFKMKLPKRLQLLEEQANSNLITAEEIAIKQKLAESRRKSAIHLKVQKSKEFQAKVLAASKNRSKNNSPNNSISSNKSNKINKNKNLKNINRSTAKIEK